MRKILTFLCAALMSVGMFAATVTWNHNDITGSGHSFTKDGVTITAGMIDFHDKNFMDGGTFTTTLGNFTKIEVTAGDVYMLSGEGWSGGWEQKTWTGNASSVSFSGEIMGMGMGVTLKFTIAEPTVAVTGVTLNQNEAQMTVGGETLTLTATVNPSNATDQSVSWSTSDANVATVDNGVVTAVAAGNATITVTTTDGSFTATCDVTVTAPEPEPEQQEESLLTTLTFGGSDTYGETTSGVVNVTATNVGLYHGTYGWLLDEGGSLSVTAKEGYTITKCVFRQNAKAPITDTEAPFEIHADGWGTIIEDPEWDMDGVTSIEVYGYAAPEPEPEPQPVTDPITPNPDPQDASVYYSTFYDSNFKYELPTGVEAYVADLSGANLLLTKIAEAGEVIPADNAVILKSTVTPFTLTKSDEAAVTFTATNDLQGSDTQIATPANCYVLAGTDGVVGFYHYTAANLNAHKAYVVYSGSNQAPKRMPFIFDQATGVENVQGDNVQSTKVIENGVLYIIKNGVKFNAQGQVVK